MRGWGALSMVADHSASSAPPPPPGWQAVYQQHALPFLMSLFTLLAFFVLMSANQTVLAVSVLQAAYLINLMKAEQVHLWYFSDCRLYVGTERIQPCFKWVSKVMQWYGRLYRAQSLLLVPSSIKKINLTDNLLVLGKQNNTIGRKQRFIAAQCFKCIKRTFPVQLPPSLCMLPSLLDSALLDG